MSLRPELTLNGAPGSWAYRFNAYGQWDDYHTNSTRPNINGGAGLGYYRRPRSRSARRIPNRVNIWTPGSSHLRSLGPERRRSLLAGLHNLQSGFYCYPPAGIAGRFSSRRFRAHDYQNVVVNGVLLNQTHSNGNAFSISSKLNYLVAPPTSLYIQGDYVRRNYDNGVDNSGTGAIVLGSKFEIRRLFQVMLMRASRYRNYYLSTIGSVGGFTLMA